MHQNVAKMHTREDNGSVHVAEPFRSILFSHFFVLLMVFLFPLRILFLFSLLSVLFYLSFLF